jgi:hypothetical protein
LTYGSWNNEWSDALDCLGWRRNPVGEIAYHFLKTEWRPNTTHAQVMQHWITVRNSASYEAGFEAAFGASWASFVCDLETHYDIDRMAQTCAGVEVPPDVTNVTCVTHGTDGTDDAGLGAAAVAGIVVAALAVVGLAGLAGVGSVGGLGGLGASGYASASTISSI